jgi:hypothetical protein
MSCAATCTGAVTRKPSSTPAARAGIAPATWEESTLKDASGCSAAARLRSAMRAARFIRSPSSARRSSFRACAVLASEADEKVEQDLSWAALDEIRRVAAIPLDARHNSKIDYPALTRLLAS